MAKHRIVIVGGGFGGIKTALELANDRRFHVTLVTDHTDFRYFPSLYRTATGGRKMISSIPLSEIFAGKGVHILNDKVVSMDRAAKTIKTKVNHELGYEALVIALGVRTNYFHISGLKELSYGIKTPADAEALKCHLHKQLIQDHKPDLNYVVVGGGPTGVELAGALPGYIRQICIQHGLKPRGIHVDLVEAAPRLVPRMPKDVSRVLAHQLRKIGVKLYLKTVVQAQTADALMVHDKAIRSHTVIWTAGIANNPFLADQGFQLTKTGKARVDQFLQAEPGIYIIGDNADTPYSGMAQTALYDGKFVARNLERLVSKQDPKPYVAKKPVYVFPAGHRWAAVLWGPIRIHGKLGWMLRSLADLVAYHDYEPWRMASRRWAAEDDTEESCPHCSGEL
jgi:NADH:ubiquinone reductase (H+-translocating)